MLSSGIGSQVQKPLAAVVVCGMMLAPFVILITLPVLIEMFSRRSAPTARSEALPQPVH
jgi:cobalt-zinc-cadmium resistance protein CzcA